MNNQHYKIRNAYPGEFEEIGKLMVDVFSNVEGFPKPADQPGYYKLLANIGEFTRKPGVELLAAVSVENKILGTVVYFCEMTHYGSGGIATREVNTAGFRLLAVNPNTRGQGIGKFLVKHCIDKTRDNKLGQLIIHTTSSMVPAWKIYERLGFFRSPELDFMQENLPVLGFRLYLDLSTSS